jgi:hypothetical protein
MDGMSDEKQVSDTIIDDHPQDSRNLALSSEDWDVVRYPIFITLIVHLDSMKSIWDWSWLNTLV